MLWTPSAKGFWLEGSRKRAFVSRALVFALEVRQILHSPGLLERCKNSVVLLIEPQSHGLLSTLSLLFKSAFTLIVNSSVPFKFYMLFLWFDILSAQNPSVREISSFKIWSTNKINKRQALFKEIRWYSTLLQETFTKHDSLKMPTLTLFAS